MSPRIKKETPTRPRGTRDIAGSSFYMYQGFFEKAADVAHYYGFTPIHTPIFEKEGVFTSGVGEHTDIIEKEMYTLRVKRGEKLALRPEGTASIVRAYIEGGMHSRPQPVLLYYHGPFFRHDKPQRGRYREFFQFGLEALGSSRGIIDAMIIRVTVAILETAGIKNLCVLINSIGDSACRDEYMKDLTAYYRKHLNTICPNCRQRMKTNPLRLLDCKDERCTGIKEEAPEIVAYLCNGCSQHFKEVLEHLDSMDIPYTIDHTLVRGLDYYTRTVFEVIEESIEDPRCEENKEEKEEESSEEDEKNESSEGEDGKDNPENEKEEVKDDKNNSEDIPKPPPLTLASGGRYDELGTQLGSKKEIPAMGVAIGVDRVLESPSAKSLSPRVLKKPKVFFIQLGPEAKLKSLSVIEILRKERIPVMQSLSKDKLSVQLAMAEKAKIRHTLIIGQKETNDDTVIVRDMSNRSQETIKTGKLGEYLKKKL
jgi:histidyl-tRNA synthetase